MLEDMLLKQVFILMGLMRGDRYDYWLVFAPTINTYSLCIKPMTAIKDQTTFNQNSDLASLCLAFTTIHKAPVKFIR
jgi:hypothetical protein